MDAIVSQYGLAKTWIPDEDIEWSAKEQIYEIIKHPRLFKWAAIMPDVHAGIGATIGSVIPLRGAIIPSAVGVDIGCGMCSVKSTLTVDEIKPHLKIIHDKIIERIPRGFAHRSESQKKDVHKFGNKDIISSLRDYGHIGKEPIFPQLGTLGGGNHFIELQQDADGKVYIMLHSGSRNIGNKLAYIHINKAKAKANAPKDLEYFEETAEDGQAYLKDMNFALNFAKENRYIMVEIIKEIMNEVIPCSFEDTINIHHNYAAKETHYGEEIWVHRKGATHVTSSITGIIPGSMGSPSYLVIGKDNEESFKSCSHGAGRTMSRGKAKGELNVEDFSKQMDGIFSEAIDASHLDEAPGAYKDIDKVMENQRELVDIKIKLTPILNIKG